MILFIMYPLIFIEMLVILILLFRSPLRKLVMAGINRFKLGRGPVVAQTLTGTLTVLLVTNLYGLFDVHKRLTDGGAINPTDQVLMAFHLLEATLLGITLFLALIIDRLHYYINELRRVRMKSQDYHLHAQNEEDVHG
ncbi:hypothetical protein RND81_09G044100 [Saponaria officinalis]|uniref:Endoplasmic reticulum transmembrane protein n=1 Tax=Saponaria officinalis TaxID=3572 RepID=A0AAW1IHC8_SAPOF